MWFSEPHEVDIIFISQVRKLRQGKGRLNILPRAHTNKWQSQSLSLDCLAPKLVHEDTQHRKNSSLQSVWDPGHQMSVGRGGEGRGWWPRPSAPKWTWSPLWNQTQPGLGCMHDPAWPSWPAHPAIVFPDCRDVLTGRPRTREDRPPTGGSLLKVVSGRCNFGSGVGCWGPRGPFALPSQQAGLVLLNRTVLLNHRPYTPSRLAEKLMIHGISLKTKPLPSPSPPLHLC